MTIAVDLGRKATKQTIMYIYKCAQNTSIGSEDNARGPFLDISKCRCDLKKLGHQNLINSFPLPNNVSMQVWSKSIQWFRRQPTESIYWTFQSDAVTLKIRPRSPKSNPLVPPPNNVAMQVLSKSIHRFR